MTFDMTCICGNKIESDNEHSKIVCNNCGLEYVYDEGVRLDLDEKDEIVIVERRLNKKVIDNLKNKEESKTTQAKLDDKLRLERMKEKNDFILENQKELQIFGFYQGGLDVTYLHIKDLKNLVEFIKQENKKNLEIYGKLYQSIKGKLKKN